MILIITNIKKRIIILVIISIIICFCYHLLYMDFVWESYVPYPDIPQKGKDIDGLFSLNQYIHEKTERQIVWLPHQRFILEGPYNLCFELRIKPGFEYFRFDEVLIIFDNKTISLLRNPKIIDDESPYRPRQEYDDTGNVRYFLYAGVDIEIPFNEVKEFKTKTYMSVKYPGKEEVKKEIEVQFRRYWSKGKDFAFIRFFR